MRSYRTQVEDRCERLPFFRPRLLVAITATVLSLAFLFSGIGCRKNAPPNESALKPGQWVVSVMCYTTCMESHSWEPCSPKEVRTWLPNPAGSSLNVLYAYVEEEYKQIVPFKEAVNGVVVLDAREAARKDIYSMEPLLVVGPFNSNAEAEKWADIQRERPDSQMTNEGECGREIEVFLIFDVRNNLQSEQRIASPRMTVEGEVTDSSGGGFGQNFQIQTEEGVRAFTIDLLSTQRPNGWVSPKDQVRVNYREINIKRKDGTLIDSWIDTEEVQILKKKQNTQR